MEIFVLNGFNREQRGQISETGNLRFADFEKNEIVLSVGQTVSEMGIVISGSVNIESVDVWGNRSIVNNISAGQSFAESYAMCKTPLLVDAVAAEKSRVAFIDILRLSDSSNSGAEWYAELSRRLTLLAAQKNLALLRRIFCTTPKSARGRIMAYLSGEAVKSGGNRVSVPFDRQQLADYLNLDRSALSRELGRMKREGIIDFKKEKFIILKTENNIGSVINVGMMGQNPQKK